MQLRSVLKCAIIRAMKTINRLLSPPDESFFLLGPRGTGKSTWLEMVYPKALKIDLLDSSAFRAYQARPERLVDFVAANPLETTIVVDEVQKVPELLDVVHQIIEKRKDLKFVLTGSSARKLRKAGTNLLGGRALRLVMPPFTARELQGAFSLDRSLEYGMLPLVFGSASPAKRHISTFTSEKKYFRKDLSAISVRLHGSSRLFRFPMRRSFRCRLSPGNAV